MAASTETCTATNLIGDIGTDQILDGESLTVDENNIVTLTLRYLKKQSEIKSVPSTVASFGGYDDFVLDSLSAEALNDSAAHFIVQATYKTLDKTQRDGDAQNEFGRVETMDYDFSEEPLEAHPNIKEIARKYGGVPKPDGTYNFPETKPDGASSSGSGGGLGFSGAGAEINPLYGMKTYPALQARYTKTFGCEVAQWKKYVTSIGKISTKVPDSSIAGDTFEGRNWLQLPPKAQKEGKFYRVSVEYMLSAPGKTWPKDVFEDL